MIQRRAIRITKGQNPYIEVTALADYCQQKGWKVIKEYVDIAVPTGDEMREFLEDMKERKIIVINSGKENNGG